MISLPFLALAIAFSIIWYLYDRHFTKVVNSYPKGPKPLPILGNLHQLDFASPVKTFTEWGKMYGPVFTIWLPKPNVVITDFKVLKEALVKQGFVFGQHGREHPDGSGIVMCQNARWQMQRRFTLHVFRNFGMGRNLMETKIMAQCAVLVDFLVDSMGKTGHVCLDIDHALTLCVANIITDIVMGRTFEYDDKNFASFKHMLDDIMARATSPKMLVVDTYPWTSEAILAANMHDVWSAGFETTVTTLRWGILFMIMNEDIQNKVRSEIDERVGRDRAVQLADRCGMSYTMATLNEIQRVGNILPINLQRKTLADTVLAGHHLRKGTNILPQISAVLSDETTFPEPHRFKPERFLDENKNLIKFEELVPFGLGKRQCLGEGMAKAELFLIFATLLQKFEFRIPNGSGPPSLKPLFGLTAPPAHFLVEISSRN